MASTPRNTRRTDAGSSRLPATPSTPDPATSDPATDPVARTVATVSENGPSRLVPRTVRTRAIPGNTESHGAERRNGCALLSSLANASGLREGGSVTVAGQLSGMVESIEFLPADGDTTQNLKVTIKEAREKKVPSLDDELAKDTGEADTLEELKQKEEENGSDD